MAKEPVAERANLAHSQIGKRDFGSIKRMIALGKILNAQKRQLPHGEWLPWIRNNLEFSAQTAERYIRLYRNRDKVMEAQPDTLAKALEAIGDRGKTRPASRTYPSESSSYDVKQILKQITGPAKVMMKEIAKVPANPMLSETDKANITAKYFQILMDAERLPSFDGIEIFCKFRFGQRLRDRVTGFTGIFTGLNQDLSGHQICSLTPPVDDDGNYVDAHSFCAATLEVVDEGIAREISSM